MPELHLGHYRIERRLGEGGMGIVFLAFDPRLNRHVAVKILRPETAATPGRRERFLREAQAAAAVNHPNLAAIHDMGEVEIDDARLLGEDETGSGPQRVAYLVLELVPGEDLRTRIARGSLPVSEIVDLGRQIADGLAAAHRAGLVHRDLKPGNLRITPEGRLKILDFGLAKWRSAPEAETLIDDPFTTTAGVVMGTAPYASPEQTLGLAVDGRSDLFSLGVVLYEMASGHLPFAGDNRLALYRSLVHEEPRPLAEVAPGLPREFTALVHQLLAKDPAERPPNAEAVGNALARLTRDATPTTAPLATPPPPTSPGLSSAARRRAIRLAAGVALAGLVGLAIALAIWQNRPAPPTASLQNLAVLPFANFTGDSALDDFGLGIAETLATQLTEIPGVNVVGPGAARPRLDAHRSPGEVGRDLGVGSLLEGGLQLASDQLRVTLQLIDAATGAQLWTRSFSGPRDQLFALQARMAQEAADAISVPLSAADRERLARDPTRSARAFDLYLKARRFLADYDDVTAPQLAIGLLEEALRLDPSFAWAHAAASEAAAREFSRERSADRLAAAEREALRAVELDAGGADARMALARVRLLQGRPAEAITELAAMPAGLLIDRQQQALAAAYEQLGDRARAEEHLLRAVALRPGFWEHWNALGDFRLRGGEATTARSAFERAVSLAPPDVTVPLENLASLALFTGDTAGALAAYARLPQPIQNDATANNVGTAHFFAGDLAEAERNFRLAARLAPGNPQYRRNLGDVFARLGQTEEARAAYAEALDLLERQLALTPHEVGLRLDHALYLARLGRCPEARRLVEELDRELPPAAETHHALGQPLALCGDRSAALAQVRAAIALGFPREMLRQEDEFQALAADAEFRELTGE